MHGDIDNDGMEELITFSHNKKDEKHHEDNISYSLILTVYKFKKTGLELIWTDDAKFGYGYSNVVPQGDTLAGIGDIDNSGRNRLMIIHPSSDVSADSYDFLIWKNGVLKKEYVDAVFEGKYMTKSGDITGISFSEFNGKKLLRAGLLDYSTGTINGIEVYGLIENGKFKVRGHTLNSLWPLATP